MTGSCSTPGFIPCLIGTKREHREPIGLAELQDFGLLQIGMGFDRNHRRLAPRKFEDLPELGEADVRQPNRFAYAPGRGGFSIASQVSIKVVLVS